jgi:hypothetical protein
MQQQAEHLTKEQATNILACVASWWSTCFTVPIRSRFGCEYPGMGGGVAFVGMPVFASLWRSNSVMVWFYAWVVILILRRIGLFIRERRGDHEFSGYQGWPWLAMKVPFVKTERTARAIEPVLYGLAAYFLHPRDEGLSAFFASGAAALFVLVWIHRQLAYKERIALRDARLEMDRHEQLIRGR